jgi:hypothetical protein
VEYFVDSKCRRIRVGTVVTKDFDRVLQSRLREPNAVNWFDFDLPYVPAKTPVVLGDGEYVPARWTGLVPIDAPERRVRCLRTVHPDNRANEVGVSSGTRAD